jgi:DNA end-binding protein Ku
MSPPISTKRFRTLWSSNALSSASVSLSSIETKAGHFEPEKFEDQYEDALKELIQKKQSGQPIERPERREPSKVINLMDALRRSVEASRESGKRQTASVKPRGGQSERPKKKKSR